ncbi:hypothetical protein PEX1_083230 [Penicillium expansum]|uniref:Uncharacterized protein n=1 Tax=Penicillium expansum TaxID=27334 RepID=A0A0A2JDV9_PENEN|nr:hypothetical protein PEX2_059820 [Penicillium expansum]KGO52976.1 hypothetical protein PEX1_083230 [Penicillium expansum]KGO53350.1 hypothetical protein PEX2_059820 [Penicillium expansum]
MGASSPEYHIVGKRVAVGRLLLGTIISNLDELFPINKGEELLIDDKDLDHFHDRNSEISRDAALAGKAGIAAKALAFYPAGGEAGVDAERSSKDIYSIPDVYTWQFDPEERDYLDAMESEKVQKFLVINSYRPVYIITGLKLSPGMSVDLTRVKKTQGGLELGVEVGTAVSIGPKLGFSKAINVGQRGEELTERIFAIRVRRLRYKKIGGVLGFGGSRKLINQQHNDGAELVGVHRPKQSQGQMLGHSYEVTEEDDTEDEIGEDRRIHEEEVTWVVPKS